MFTRILVRVNKGQSGFTLVELIVAVAITSLITIGIMVTIFQVMSGSMGGSDEAKVVRQAQNAGYWISRDAQMANEISVIDDPGTEEQEVVTIIWYLYTYHDDDETDRDGDGYKYVYRLLDDELWRDYYFAEETYDEDSEEWIVIFGDEPDYTTFIAENISEIEMVPFGLSYQLTVTASIESWQPQSETRIYEVKPRPNIF